MQIPPVDIDVKKISEELKIRPEIYIKITSSFVNSLPGKLNILNDAITTNDRDQMRMTLHEIKGTAGNLRLKNLTAVEEVIHEAVKNNEPQSNLYKYFEALRVESEKLQKYIFALAQKDAPPAG